MLISEGFGRVGYIPPAFPSSGACWEANNHFPMHDGKPTPFPSTCWEVNPPSQCMLGSQPPFPVHAGKPTPLPSACGKPIPLPLPCACWEVKNPPVNRMTPGVKSLPCPKFCLRAVIIKMRRKMEMDIINRFVELDFCFVCWR